jgi:mannose/fructose/N-acetylgalactosamine-specific phosphotransferase system component IIB
MSVLLVRIDDRLIHGQVSVGWAGQLKPDLILVLDDEVAADDWENDLVCAACPDSVAARVMPVAAGAAWLAGTEAARQKIVVLVRGTKQARALVEGGLGLASVNVGGLHHHAGARSFLPYVFLDDAEIADLNWLARQGVRLNAQDLPGNKGIDLAPLIAGKGA